MGSELAVVEADVVSISKQQNAVELYKQATNVAGVCGEIVKRTAQAIGGRKYVRVEGWQTIAATYGCVAGARDVERTATGFRAIGEIKRVSDGATVATAEGFVGDDEPTWASRPEYAKRAMAQTRAISRACRSAFAFVVVMIDADLSTTPAEEVPDGGFHVDASKSMPAPAGVEKLRQQVARPTPPPSGAGRVHEDISFRFGNDKGKPISTLGEGTLRWYAAALERDIADPAKERWKASATHQLDCVRAELSFRGLSA